MAKSSQDQAFEEIHNYQEPERPDPREYYRNAQGKEVSLDFFLYTCLEEEKTCDALRGDFAHQLTLKRWTPLIPYIEEEVFDERDERVSTEEIADHTPEDLIKTLCRWYAETYPQLAASETLDYFVHMELVQEFILFTKDLKAMLSAKKVRLNDKLPGEEKEAQPQLTALDAEPSQPETSAPSVMATEPRTDPTSDHESDTTEEQVEENQAEASEATGEGLTTEAVDGDHQAEVSEATGEDVASQTETHEQNPESTPEDLQPPSEDQAAEAGVKESLAVINSSPVEKAAESDVAEEEPERPTYAEILEEAISGTFPAYRHMMMEYINWTHKKSVRVVPDLANLPPVGRYLNLLRKRSGGRFRDNDSHRSGPSGRDRGPRDRQERGRYNRDQSRERGPRDRNRDRNRGQESSEGTDNKERENHAIREAKRGLSYLKNNPDKESFQLNPENSFIRRIQHKYIKDQPGFSSRSAGDGQDRAVKITRKS